VIKINSNTRIKIIIFVIIASILAVGIVLLTMLDARHSEKRNMAKLRQQYMKVLNDYYEKQAANAAKKGGSDEMTFDEARKSLPKVDKVDYPSDMK